MFLHTTVAVKLTCFDYGHTEKNNKLI